MTTKKPDPAKSREVAARLEDQILRSGLRPGWRLPSEEQLCRTHGVSRTVVREAIQQLKARGLVDSRRGGGTYVATIEVGVIGRAMLAYSALTESPEAFGDILDLRAQLENGCVREIARLKDKEAVARIRARLDALRRTRDDADRFAEAELAFRRQLAEESGGLTGRALLDAINGAIAAVNRRAFADPERRDRAVAAHDALHEALRTGNPDAASALAFAHAAKERPGLVEARVR